MVGCMIGQLATSFEPDQDALGTILAKAVNQRTKKDWNKRSATDLAHANEAFKTDVRGVPIVAADARWLEGKGVDKIAVWWIIAVVELLDPSLTLKTAELTKWTYTTRRKEIGFDLIVLLRWGLIEPLVPGQPFRQGGKAKVGVAYRGIDAASAAAVVLSWTTQYNNTTPINFLRQRGFAEDLVA